MGEREVSILGRQIPCQGEVPRQVGDTTLVLGSTQSDGRDTVSVQEGSPVSSLMWKIQRLS